MQTREHYVAGQAPDWRASKPAHKAPEPRAWDYPLTPAVMVVLAFAVAFVVVLAVAGILP